MNVAIIPARGGSKRIPRKNIRPFHGTPIIAYSIGAALDSRLFDGGVWVSTEDREIAGVALNYGAGLINRPPELAEIGAPDCGTQEVTRHALTSLNVTPADYACCIYPCAPLLRSGDLATGLQMLKSEQLTWVYAVGWFYWGKAASFLQGLPLEEHAGVMETHRAIDIDTEEDWARAEQLYAQRQGVAA